MARITGCRFCGNSLDDIDNDCQYCYADPLKMAARSKREKFVKECWIAVGIVALAFAFGMHGGCAQ